MFHKRLMKEFKDNRKMTAAMVFLQWLMLLCNVLLMITASRYIGKILTESLETTDTVLLAAVLVFVLIARGLLAFADSRLSFAASFQVKQRIRSMVYEKLLRLGSSYRSTVSSSEAVQISTEGVEQLEIYFGRYLPQFFYSMLAPVTLFVIVGTMSLKVAAVLLLCVPFIPVSIIAVQKFAKKMLQKYWGTYTELGDSFLECLQGLTTLKIFQADGRYAKKMDEEAEKFRKVTMKVLIMQLNSISVMDLVAYGGAALGILLSVLELQKGSITVEQCFFMIMISSEFFLPLRLLGSFFHIAMNGNAAADKIFRLMDTPKRVCGNRIPMAAGEISMEDVTFGYDSAKEVLKGVSLHLEQGLTALAGESGCGKSTVISLLMGEQVMQEGSITLGGVELAEIQPEVLQKHITRIRHDSYIFQGTIRENLLMGNPQAKEEELYAVLKKVDLLETVKENGGLDMKLTERAANLSGGQKQRLALARALLHDSSVYIFDEAASNVDVESENRIMEVICRLAEEKTVLLVSHRLANIRYAKQIYVMREGRITASGSHEALCKTDCYYRNLYEKQKELESYGKQREPQSCGNRTKQDSGGKEACA